METITILVVFTVAVAFIFDVINGFHDAANSIATIVSTRVLRPRYAVLWAAFFNFVAMFVFAPRVADTMSKIVDVQADDTAYVWVVLAGLIGAIIWDLLTWWWGLPTSSSHAIIGGFAGAGVAHAGFDILNWDKILITIGFIPLAPVLGLVVAVILVILVSWIFRRWTPPPHKIRPAVSHETVKPDCAIGGNLQTDDDRQRGNLATQRSA